MVDKILGELEDISTAATGTGKHTHTSDTIEDEISDSVQQAQREAEEEVNKLEAEFTVESADTVLQVPSLLRVEKSGELSFDMRNKADELKARGQQLDLLLLKAESYSHFIRENQRRSLEKLEAAGNELSSKKEDVLSPDSGKKRKSRGGSNSSHKKSKSIDGSPAIKVSSSPTRTNAFTQPSNLVGGTLMDYQLQGLKWLLSLYENGLSGILADEMGLGKTIQIIALVAQLRALKTGGPFLIAGPLATIPNWVNEFRKWLPSARVVMYHGSKSEREFIRTRDLPLSQQRGMDFPIVVTSFEICMIDRPFLAHYDWQYIILDEGHRIKNRNCRLVRELKQIRSTNRLLLTGTPIQNTLEELWSLLNFVNPQIFDDLAVFQAWFGFHSIGRKTQVEDIVDTEQQSRVVSKLHEILRPFLLRRMKTDVLLTMPPKLEVVVYCGLTALQADYYARVHGNCLRAALVSMGVEGGKDTSQNNLVMQLRKVCNHPFLFGEPRDEQGRFLGEVCPQLLIAASGKFKVLDRLLSRLQAGGHKVLIFSQMTRLLDILQDYLAFRAYSCCRLDGSCKVVDRQRSIDAFNNDPSIFCFLLSTRAGGLGINLTAADTVILFDSDWNPHQDSQAMDRCHRVGQRRPVVVYRLITADSVEIDMLEKQISKKKLERLTIHGGDYRLAGERAGGSLTLSRLRQLLEDDVKNLARKNAASAFTGLTGDGMDGGSVSTATETQISDEELQLILDRKKLFAVGDEAVPREGVMYDVVAAATSSVLQSINSSTSNTST